ncbi:hypothetical protein [Nostoc sp.]
MPNCDCERSPALRSQSQANESLMFSLKNPEQINQHQFIRLLREYKIP